MSGGLTRVAGSLVRPYFSNLSTVRPDELPTCTTLRANLRAGMAITHSPVALSAAKLKLLPLTTHATCGLELDHHVPGHGHDVGVSAARRCEQHHGSRLEQLVDFW
jgi:hypothetical protein